jgi:hypothetical protein
MKRTLMLLPLALLGFGLPAQAEVVQKQTITTTMVFPNACTLENVDFTVTYNFLFRVKIDGNTAETGLHINMAGTGVGETSGANYTINSADNMDFHIALGTNNTFAEHMNVIGQGNVPNFKVHFTGHVTVDANGNVTAFLDNLSQTCQ